MKKQLAIGISSLLLIVVTTLPSTASQSETTIKGEVVQVQQQIRTENDGAFDQLRVRTRQGQEMRLQLGKAGNCPGCVQVGDQIRARVRSGADGQAAQVQSMKVRREGSMYSYRFQNGELAQNPARMRARDGSGAGRSNREQWQRGSGGNGNCRGNGGGSRGSGAGGSGGSRGGGGG